jgi:hypothetical protein
MISHDQRQLASRLSITRHPRRGGIAFVARRDRLEGVLDQCVREPVVRGAEQTEEAARTIAGGSARRARPPPLDCFSCRLYQSSVRSQVATPGKISSTAQQQQLIAT